MPEPAGGAVVLSAKGGDGLSGHKARRIRLVQTSEKKVALPQLQG
jgi:hypothetical protein